MVRKAVTLLVISSVLVSQLPAQQAATQAPAASKPGKVKVHRHTGLKFATLQPLSSATAKIGDDVPLRLTKPLTIDGFVVLKEGEVVHARVESVKKAEPKCRDGKLKLKVDQIKFGDASTTKTKIWSVDANPEAEVADWLYKERRELQPDDLNPIMPANNWYEAVLSIPLDAFAIACESPLLAVVGMAYLFGAGEGCYEKGIEYQLPAGATVAVEVPRAHYVRR